jgi:RimJ/RimL family protein N-acetyltransferase
MLLIRRIHLGEAELFRCIRLAALREAPRAFGSTHDSAMRQTPESWREQADTTARGSDRATFLAFSDESPIGIIALYRLGRESDTGELIQMWIAPEYRGRGIAKRMIDIAFQWAGQSVQSDRREGRETQCKSAETFSGVWGRAVKGGAVQSPG